jgi:uncharacterized membrane protein
MLGAAPVSFETPASRAPQDEASWESNSHQDPATMGKARLEAFTDGVIAIIITIMVLEMKVPAGTDVAALAASAPVFSAYVLS